MRRIILAAMIIGTMVQIAFPAWQNIMNWRLPDNDDAMRVLEVRAWLQGQGFYDIFNHRLNPPNGGDVHWSRLGDIPLLLANVLLLPFLGSVMAEKAAAFFTPLLLGAIFVLVSGKAAYALENSRISFFVGVFAALSTAGAMSYFVAGRVDHHGLQLIFLVASFWGLFSHKPKGAIVAGLMTAASLTIGFEMVPILAFMIAWLAIIWGIRGNNIKKQALYFSCSLALGTIIGFLINVPPQEYLTSVNDALSIAQALPILVGCVGLGLAAMFLSQGAVQYRFAALMIVALIVVLVGMQFPILMRKLYWQIDPLLVRLWVNAIVETHPLTKTDPSVQLSLGMFAVIMSAAAVIKVIVVIIDAAKKPDDIHNRDVDNWSLLAIVLVGVTLMAVFWQARVAGQASTIAAFSASALITGIFKRQGLRNAILVGLVLNPLMPAMAATAYKKLYPKKTQYAVGGGGTCRGMKAYSEMAKLPKGLVAAPIDFGAQTLIATHHNVLAAPYHRNQGNMVAYRIFLAKPDEALILLDRSNVDYVAICTMSAEVGIISREAPNGLMSQLKDGRIPNYLRRVPTPAGSNVQAFEVLK